MRPHLRQEEVHHGGHARPCQGPHRGEEEAGDGWRRRVEWRLRSLTAAPSWTDTLTAHGFTGEGGDDGWISAGVPCNPSVLEAADEGGDGSPALRRRTIRDRLCVERRGRGWGQISGSPPWMRRPVKEKKGAGVACSGCATEVASPTRRRQAAPLRWLLRLGDDRSAPCRTDASTSVPHAEGSRSAPSALTPAFSNCSAGSYQKKLLCRWPPPSP
jgi:hypothetical protein